MVPSFGLAGCPSGPVVFEQGMANPVFMRVAAVGDIDRDGVDDFVVNLQCVLDAHNAGGSMTQVVAYSGRGLELMGRVAAGPPEASTEYLSVGANGDVVVEVIEGHVPAASVRWVSYRWMGTAFQQVGSADRPGYVGRPTDLALTMEPGSVRLAADGSPVSVTVTVHNRATEQSRPATLVVRSSRAVRVALDPAEAGAGCCHTLVIDLPPAGQSAKITFTVGLEGGASLEQGTGLTFAVTGHSLGYTGNGSNVTQGNVVTISLTQG
jgi:hypothetical protein